MRSPRSLRLQKEGKEWVRALERGADPKQRRFGERQADQLQPDREAVGGEAGGERERGQAQIIERAGEAAGVGDGERGIGTGQRGQGWRRDRRGREQQHRRAAKDVVGEGGGGRVAPSECVPVVRARNRAAAFEPDANLRVELSGVAAEDPGVGSGRLE